MEAFAAFSKHPSQQGKAEVQEDVEEERELESIIWTFFWILIAAFAGVIVLGYLRRLRS
jgi:hypothetical protein